MTFNPGADPFRLRVGLSNIGDSVSAEFKLYAKKNSGSYAAITTSSTGGVLSYNASSDADNTAIQVPRLYPFSPDWQLSGAAIDLDFANDRIYPSGAFTDYLSCTRSSDGYAKNLAGEWVQFSSNELRITDLGYLVESGSRTNYLLNSGVPVTQTTESLGTGDYTLWVEGSGSAIASNGSGTITGAESATEGSPSLFTVTGAGTVTVTVTGTLDRFQMEKGTTASSYIPTTVASAARAADAVTLIGNLSTTLAGSAASVVVEADQMQQFAGNTHIIGTDDIHMAIGLLTNETNKIQAYENPEGINATLGGGKTWPLNRLKVGSCWNSSGRSLVGDAGTVVSDAFVPTAPNRLMRYNAFGYCRRITVWSSRLADATLQGFTAP